MIPNVFVSSTIEDLHHLRDAVRDVIADLGYTPVMSEYGDIPYLPGASAQESCYRGVGNCQMAVIIVGKRYGEITDNGLSVTHNEYRRAREAKIPVFVIVDHEVLAFKKVYDAQTDDKKPTMPGMDDAQKTFALIGEIAEAPINNGILVFKSVGDVRANLKNQMAHLFGELLKTKVDPLKSRIDDVLSEVKTLSNKLLEGASRDSSTAFLRTIRFLLDDENQTYKRIAEWLHGTADAAVPTLIAAATFEDFIVESGGSVKIVENLMDSKDPKEFLDRDALSSQLFGVGFGGRAAFSLFRDKHIELNQTAKDYFEGLHSKLRNVL